jgi:hypothetical protein
MSTKKESMDAWYLGYIPKMMDPDSRVVIVFASAFVDVMKAATTRIE